MRITFAGGSYSPIISVSFRYKDRFKAQAVVQTLISTMHDIDTRNQPETLTASTVLPANLDVTNPPSAGVPFQPNRYLALAIGLGAGILLAGITRFLMRVRTIAGAVN